MFRLAHFHLQNDDDNQGALQFFFFFHSYSFLLSSYPSMVHGH